MSNSYAFENSIHRDGESALHVELIRRLQQHGLTSPFRGADDASLADLLSAIDTFERAVERAGGDLYVDSLDSSEPEHPNFVLPHPRDDERIEHYIKRVTDAIRQIDSRQ